MGIGQVNKTVSQMTRMLQQNVALVERVSVASRALAEQAKALRSTVAALRLRDDYTVTDWRLTSAAALGSPSAYNICQYGHWRMQWHRTIALR